MEKKKNVFGYIALYVVMALLGFATYYFTLPPLNVQSVDFWLFAAWIALLCIAPYYILNTDIFKNAVRFAKMRSREQKKNANDQNVKKGEKKRKNLLLIIPIVPILILGVGSIASLEVFNASAYASVIEVSEAEFVSDMPETDRVTHIALMDTDTAKIIGSRTLGSLSHVVSQYEVSEDYSQINYMGTPKKVSNLEYAGFFKWIGNRGAGIPGYVLVDPVDNTAKYVELKTPLRFVQSGYLNDDLNRKLRFSYPTKILGTPSFEIDDEGRAVFIVPCYRPKVSMFGAEDVDEVIVFDPATGESVLYSLDKTPAWIDEVYNGYLACEKYDWKGMYSGGFINSIIGQKDCKVTTDDFGYVIQGDDVWYYTGVTSVNSDKSNIGFIMTNARTGEYKFYPVIGAEEHSAMAAAEGEVQEKEYTASFPALINASGQPTYIMTLKDVGGLVKLYALVNVEKYSIVATGTTQEKAMEAYEKLLLEEGLLKEQPDTTPEVDTVSLSVTVDRIQIVTIDSDSYIYISAPDKNGSNRLFRSSIAADESLLLIREGDVIALQVTESNTKGIFEIVAWSFGKK
ncbi:MAG: hypothetical protein E7643_02305 [Ruminococcaceae bacterium]|nr:hypothetical protein [Oscillospiraceae bacterium]